MQADELNLIRDRMRERGPDAANTWISEGQSIGLAHRRLSILDLSPAGNQPMFSSDGELAVVFNGEIYNYPEIRARLAKSGVVFRSHSDTEVLLHLYRSKGFNMLAELRGMYAFALWDNTNKMLFAARDPLGVKPLYYSDDSKTLRVASQVKALLAGGRIDTQPDPAGHVGFFLWGHVPEPHTLYERIKPLPPGSYLIAKRDSSPKLIRFCDVAEILSQVPGNSASDRNTEVKDVLHESVKHHLLSDVPIGIFLSSGVDSCALAGLAVEHSSQPVHTVTLGMADYRGGPQDETILAQKISRYYGTRHHAVWLSQTDFSEDLERLLSNMDQPSIDGVNTYFASLAAAQSGLKVALSGLGGDEVFGGYRDFKRIPKLVSAVGPLNRFAPLWRLSRRICAKSLSGILSPKYASLLEHGSTYGGAYLLARCLFLPWEIPGILDPDMVREGLLRLNSIENLDDCAERLPTPRAKVAALQMKWYMQNQLLRDSDWAGMAHSIEIRVPFVDLHLIRQLTGSILSANPPGKAEIAAAPARRVPQEIVDRRKTGFSIPVDRWSRSLRGRTSEKGLRGWARHVYESYTSCSAA